ncbi:hypothetical protein ACFYUJ_02585 [Streptomyces sp. NPDC004520]|uniref:hypothetical protein n=1 Tax=Streptomyces sp. NPDC004520 TaxID=3364702 RepID=UPI0036C94799
MSKRMRRAAAMTGVAGLLAVAGGADVTGDGRADLLARDKTGVLWLYRGTGGAGAPFATRTRIGSGWNTYDRLF